ncbi:response regulator transcription factor [Lentibacillus salicampi]|uniref:Heme response regulator HssR n=2 Tax=Lentibacillus salicampi TaxID=175306 RepID=A0A4Y9A9B6_9BACI|nr:response regulator transcription factor [Lentibacillus salicampi]
MIADDDPHIRELLRFYLQKEGYRTLEAADGEEAAAQLETDHIQLAIVDIMMPHVDGYQLCTAIRNDYDIPVIMVTAKGDITDKEKGFSAGTDDYMVKPFEPKEVLYRIKALLRRFNKASKDIIQLGDTVINRKSYEVRTNGKTIILPLKEFELLAQLASFPDRIFTRNELIVLVWGQDFVGYDRTVDVHVKRLRERFSENNSDFLIKTVRGRGYKLEIPTQRHGGTG